MSEKINPFQATPCVKISIIISVLNGESTLKRCIDSILTQSYISYEIIIIDGKSCDNSNLIIASYGTHIFHHISEPDSGIYEAWNKGLKLASGDWICFLGCDDFFWDEKVFERINVAANGNKNLKLNYIYGKAAIINKKLNLKKIVGIEWETASKKLLHSMSVPHSGSFHSKNLFEKIGSFNESFKIAGDYEILLRARNELSALFIDEITVGFSLGGISSNPKNVLKSLLEVRKAKKINKVAAYSLTWYLLYIKAMLKLVFFKKY